MMSLYRYLVHVRRANRDERRPNRWCRRRAAQRVRRQLRRQPPVRVPLPDGSVRELPDGSTGADLAADIGPGLARAALAIRVLDGDKVEKRDGTAYDDGRIIDLDVPLTDDQPIEILTAKAGDGDALKLLRHDIAHVLAESVLELYPGTKVSIGPPIAEGFYYDFEFPPGVTINEDDFPKIEAQMKKHVKAAEPFVREEATTADAIDRYLRKTSRTRSS